MNLPSEFLDDVKKQLKRQQKEIDNVLRNQIESMFLQLDTNQDGKISREEVSLMCDFSSCYLFFAYLMCSSFV